MPADFNQLDNFFMSSKKEPEKPSRFSLFSLISSAKKWFEKRFPSRKQILFLPRLLSNSERRILVLLIVIAVSSFVSMPIVAYYNNTVSTADYGGSWTEGMIGRPQHINPVLVQANDVDSDIAKLIYSGLMRYDGNGILINDLAEYYTISDDGLLYTFKLRENLTWHDGMPITADDVAYTIATTQNIDFASPQRGAWFGIEVTKLDNLTITLKLKNRYAQFLQNATLGILPKHIWEPVKPANFPLFEKNLKPVGSGPYKFSKLIRSTDGMIESYEMVAFDKFSLGKPFISKIILKFYSCELESECANNTISAYNNGDIEGISTVSSQNINLLRHRGQINIMGIKMPRYFAIFFNQSNSLPLSDKSIRTALQFATDKNKLVKDIVGGRGMIVDSPLLPEILDIPHPKEPYLFNSEKAKSLISGKQLPITIELTTSSNLAELPKLAEEIKSQWESIGVTVNIRTMTISEILQVIKNRSYEALLFGESLSVDPDPFSFWNSSEKKEPGLNLAIYDNKEADKILAEARQIMDRDARFAKYDEFQNIVMNDSPAVFLYSPDYIYIQPKKIKNYTATLVNVPSNRFDTVHTWYIDTQRKSR